jgi:NAD(P)-dependent dehydrogenase (short-subunit alcohol dehydrogenase family)
MILSIRKMAISKLTGEVAIVSSASRGIGRAIARRAAASAAIAVIILHIKRANQ